MTKQIAELAGLAVALRRRDGARVGVARAPRRGFRVGDPAPHAN